MQVALPPTHLVTLPNGLTLAAEQRPGPGFAFDLRIPIGSAHDPQGLQGSASLLEEWLGKGAGSRDAREFQDALDDLGLRRGGGVGAEATRFAVSGLNRDLEAALALYADLVQRPHLPEDELEVLTDLARQDLEAMADSPAEQLSLEARRLAFPALSGPYAGYAHPASGTLEGLSAVTSAALKAAFGRYGSAGSVLSVVSAHPVAEVQRMVEALFSHWPAGSAEAVPLGEFFRQAAAALERRPPTVAVPDWAAEVIWRLEHARAVLTGARPLITKDTARAGRRPVVYAHGKVQSATGLTFRPLADTLAWCAAGLRENPTSVPSVIVS